MTMKLVFNEEKTEKIRSILLEWVEVWKVVDDEQGVYRSPFSNIRYYQFDDGFQISEMPSIGYLSKYLLGFHFHAKKSKKPFAGWLPSRSQKYLKCYVHKSWIMNMGLEYQNKLVFVAPFAIFPVYPATEANLNDYLEKDKLCQTQCQTSSQTYQTKTNSNSTPKLNVI